jgi:hypothetical protein
MSNSSIIFKYLARVASLYIADNMEEFRNVRMINRINDTSNFYILKICKLSFFNIQVANHAAVSVFDMKNLLLSHYIFDFYCNFISYKNMLYPNYNI